MSLIGKFKNFVLGTLAGTYSRTSFTYMSNIIHGQLDNTHQYIKKAYQLNADVYAITSFIASKVASVPFVLYEVKDEKALMKYKSLSASANPHSVLALRYKALSELPGEHRLMKLINKRPNEYMTASEFKYGYTIYRLITGNSFIRGFAPESDPEKFVELHLMPSHLTVPLGGMAYAAARAYRMTWDPEEIPAAQVSHSRYFNPDFEWPGNPHIIGQAPLMAAANVVLRSNSGMDASIKNLQNGGVAGILYQEGGTDLSETQRELLQEHIDKKTSSSNYKQILAASSKMGWLKIGDNAADLGLIELGLSGLRALCNIFHTNSALFNDPENKSYNNISEARKAAITDAVLPELVALRDAFNSWLVPGWEKSDKKRYFIDFDASVFPEMSANQKEISEWLEKAWWITPNEKRQQQDYDVLGEEYDQPFIPVGVAPLGSGSPGDDIDFNKAFNKTGDIDYRDLDQE